jgi:hypothetical protein
MRQITTKEAFERCLKRWRKDFRTMLGHTSHRDVWLAANKLRERLGRLDRDAWGFFPEYESMSGQAQRDLNAARDAAELDCRANLDRAYTAAVEAERTERWARAPIRGYMSDGDYRDRQAVRASLGLSPTRGRL